MITLKPIYMEAEDWADLEFFKRREIWGQPSRIRRDLILALEKFRKILGYPVVINCGTQGIHVAGSAHYRGEAVDIHVPGVHVLDQFFAASRIPDFHGIGVYPCWASPGLHLDIRHLENGQHRALWVQDDKKNYLDLSWSNLSAVLEGE